MKSDRPGRFLGQSGRKCGSALRNLARYFLRNDRFYASGGSFQNPLQNLFQFEMTANQLYPDVFGEWPRFEEGRSYPEFSEDE